jgi:SAM-dependent methyltransferase
MPPPLSQIRWFENPKDFREYSEQLLPTSCATEGHIGGLETLRGYCSACNRMTDFIVRVGVYYAERPSLREGLRCRSCGLNNRERLMHFAVLSEVRARLSATTLLLERVTPLYAALSREISSLCGTEFLGVDRTPGQVYSVAGTDVRHESATDLSFASETFDLAVHNDILEHIFDYRAALQETCRVLQHGGVLLFICPFFERRESNLVRARLRIDGSIEHLEPPEMHGNPLSKDGILACYHFGWPLFDDLQAAGFADVRIGVLYDPASGFTSNNYPPGDMYGRMLPMLFRAEK